MSQVHKIHLSIYSPLNLLLLTQTHPDPIIMGKLDIVKRADRVGFESNGLRVKTGHFKLVKNGFRLIRLRVRFGWVDPYFSHEFFFLKRNNMLLFEKSCNKLIDVKCITLNSPLISRMNYTY